MTDKADQTYQVFTRVCNVLDQHFAMDLVGHLSPTKNLGEDFGADNLDLVELVLDLEDEFDIVLTFDEFKPEDTLWSIMDCVAAAGKFIITFEELVQLTGVETPLNSSKSTSDKRMPLANKTSPSSDTIASDEDSNVPESLSDNLSGNPLQEAVEAIDKALESSSPMYSLQGLISLTTAHPLMSFTFINGRCELEYDETIYNVDKDEDVWGIVEAIKTLDKYKLSEEN